MMPRVRPPVSPPLLRLAAIALPLAIGAADPSQPPEARPARPAPAANATPTGARPDGTTIIACAVPGTSVVVSCLPAGRNVKKGEVLGELDSSRFRDQLNAQLREVRRAEAELANARLNREAAELAAKEDVAEGHRERDGLRGEIALAEKERDLAQSILKDRERAAKAVGADAGRARAEAKLQRIQFKLQKLRGQLRVLEQLTIPRRAKEAEAQLSMARAEETRRATARTSAEEVATQIRKQVEACRIVSPAAGMLLHVRPRGPEDEPRAGNLEPGSLVREGQPLFRIVPDSAPIPSRAPVGTPPKR